MHHLPHKLPLNGRAERGIRFSPLLAEVAHLSADAVFARMKTSPGGLSDEAAAYQLSQSGPNMIATERPTGWPHRLLNAFRNPLVLLLIILAAVAFATGDIPSGCVMMAMVSLGVLLRFVQETKADAAAQKLKAMINVTATVTRGGTEAEIPLKALVPGDFIRLSAGDMIPADIRLISAKDLFIAQSALTGESLPIEKSAETVNKSERSPLDLPNLAFLGTSVQSGVATAVVLATGENTYFGSMARKMSSEPDPTAFDKGARAFTTLMIRFMLVMAPLVFLINGATKHNWQEAFFFALAVAVGLTPEMLPMIVSVCLSKGAIAMARKKVIVKQLSAIQNLGAMDILCTDKTGTLTMDQVILQRHCDVVQKESTAVFLDAYLIAHFQTGLKSALDRAVIDHPQAQKTIIQHYRKLDEIPFNFLRRTMSVLVSEPDGASRLLTKGAPEAVFARCSSYELDGNVHHFGSEQKREFTAYYENLSRDGFRVLALAYKPLTGGPPVSTNDESDLILKGYIAFLDPPKDSAKRAIDALQNHGITIKVLTGDNDLVTRKVCHEVGLEADTILLGNQIESMSDEELAVTARECNVFARLSPAHKERIIIALKQQQHVVGFLGDGINDAPALHSADVGLSVDTAVDIARAAAPIILLEKDLMVLDEGVIEGRKVFVNIVKYVRMGASSSFGNMFSVVGASAFLPYIPMTPIQVLTNNLLYDFSQIPIPTDAVEPEQVTKPRPWDIGGIRRFVLLIGPVSSIFDYTTFFVMLYLFDCWAPARAPLFQTGWFVESLVTQTLIIHVIRTNKIPFIQGRASLPLTVTTLSVVAAACWLPFSPLAASLGLVALPVLYWPLLLLTAIAYIALTQVVKVWLIKKTWLP